VVPEDRSVRLVFNAFRIEHPYEDGNCYWDYVEVMTRQIISRLETQIKMFPIEVYTCIHILEIRLFIFVQLSKKYEKRGKTSQQIVIQQNKLSNTPKQVSLLLSSEMNTRLAFLDDEIKT